MPSQDFSFSKERKNLFYPRLCCSLPAPYHRTQMPIIQFQESQSVLGWQAGPTRLVLGSACAQHLIWSPGVFIKQKAAKLLHTAPTMAQLCTVLQECCPSGAKSLHPAGHWVGKCQKLPSMGSTHRGAHIRVHAVLLLWEEGVKGKNQAWSGVSYGITCGENNASKLLSKPCWGHSTTSLQLYYVWGR